MKLFRTLHVTSKETVVFDS